MTDVAVGASEIKNENRIGRRELGHFFDALFRHRDISRAARLQHAARSRRAGVAELVDALDLGSSDASRGGSNPSARTT